MSATEGRVAQLNWARGHTRELTTEHQRSGTWWSLALYTVLSLALFGAPVLGHFGSRVIASDPIDSSQFMWFFAWWPHALLHGLNPFVTHVMFVPQGFNLTWSTAMPGPAILLTPVTELFSPAVTYNVIQLASPALSAWTAFLLCRHLTGRVAPSLLGGYLYGFSPYVLIHLTGGPYLALVPLLPVFVLLVLRRVEESITPRRFVVYMALALVGQYLISSEVLATATLFGGAALVFAFALLPDRRPVLIDTVKWLVVAYAITVVVISPFLYYFLFGHQYPPGALGFVADLASFSLPPQLVALTRHQPGFLGANTEGYLGLPLIALVAIFWWQERRSRTGWILVLSLLTAAICSLGPYLLVRGHLTSFPLPWLPLSKLPVLRWAIPVRLAVFVVLPAAVIAAVWLSRRSRQTRTGAAGWALGLLAVAAIVPDVGSSAWNTPIHDPAFFANGAYRHYLKPTDNVITVPTWGPNGRWQADTGFRFRLAGGYAGNPFPASFTRYPTYQTLLTGQLSPNYALELRRFVRDKGVTAIVVDQTVLGPWRKLFGSLGVRPVATGGVLFYRLRPSPTGAA